jgi:drug/metabolite transporter (DMT)-like permease
VSRVADRFAVVLVALGAMLWGTDALFRAPLLRHLSSDRLIQSTQLVLMEHVILVVCSLPLLWLARDQIRRLNRRQWSAIVAIGVGASGLATVLFTISFGYGHFIETLLLQKTQPLIAILLASLWLRERLAPAAWGLVPVALVPT